MTTRYLKITPRMVRADLRRMARGQEPRLPVHIIADAALNLIKSGVPDETVARVPRKTQAAVEWLEALYRLPDPRL